MEQFYNTFLDHFKEPPTSILEIGSRDGHHAEELRKLANIEPCSVNVVEPHPVSYRNIIKTYPDFKTFEFAISDTPGVLPFNAIPPDTYTQDVVGTSSLLSVVKNHENLYPPANWIKVLAVTGQTLLRLIDRWQIDLVKIDVEGYTYQVLKSFGADIRLLRALHVEVELAPFQLWEGQRSYQEIHQYLSSFGFKELYYNPLFWGGRQGDNVWVRLD